MTENIKRLFQQMDHATRKKALTCLLDEFNVKRRKWVKNEWIIGGRIPEAYQERIVELFQNLLKQSMPTGR